MINMCDQCILDIPQTLIETAKQQHTNLYCFHEYERIKKENKKKRKQLPPVPSPTQPPSL